MASQISPVQQATLNLRTLCDALGGIAVKWFKIGIQLGIPHNKLLEFQGSPDPLSAVIDYWLRGNVTETVSPISWSTIEAMLRSNHVGELGLADDISRNYCMQKDVPSQVSEPTQNEDQQNEDQVVEKDTTDTTSQISASSSEGKLDSGVRTELERIFHRNLKEIISEYASYVDRLCIAIEEKGVSVDRLRSYLLSLSATSTKDDKLTLLSDKANELHKCTTVTDIFNFLTTECASFLNYDIFQFILKRYNVSDPEILKYPELLKAYVNEHKISELSKKIPQVKPKRNGSMELTLKYDVKTTCCLAKLIELKKLIADIMEISSLALEIVDIEEGCVIVTFFIPAFLANVLFTPDTVFTPQQEEKLQVASVLWMKCNGHTFHFDKKKLKEEALQKLLSCSICLGTYTDPKQLQCQHAYCQQCLMGLVQQDQQGQPTLTCPTCRQVTPVPASGVAGLQADFRANQLLGVIDEEWKEFFLSKPQVASSEPASEEISNHETTPPYCPDHDKLLIEIFCRTCKEAICWKCFRDKHSGHDCEALNDVFIQCKGNILSLLQTIDYALTKLDTCCDEISYQRSAIEEEIHNTITMDDRKTELISQLHQLTLAKLKRLAVQRDHIETIQAQLNKHLHFMQDTSNQVEALQMKSITVKQVQEFTLQSSPKEKLTLSFLKVTATLEYCTQLVHQIPRNVLSQE